MHPPPHLCHPLRWWRLYLLEPVMDGLTYGDGLVHWAFGVTMPPQRPASAWQLINDTPPFTNAKEAK